MNSTSIPKDGENWIILLASGNQYLLDLLFETKAVYNLTYEAELNEIHVRPEKLFASFFSILFVLVFGDW